MNEPTPQPLTADEEERLRKRAEWSITLSSCFSTIDVQRAELARWRERATNLKAEWKKAERWWDAELARLRAQLAATEQERNEARLYAQSVEIDGMLVEARLAQVREAATDVVWLWDQWANVELDRGQDQMSAIQRQVDVLRRTLDASAPAPAREEA